MSFCGSDFGKYEYFHFNLEIFKEIAQSFCFSLLEYHNADDSKLKFLLDEIEQLSVKPNNEKKEEKGERYVTLPSSFPSLSPSPSSSSFPSSTLSPPLSTLKKLNKFRKDFLPFFSDGDSDYSNEEIKMEAPTTQDEPPKKSVRKKSVKKKK